MDIDLKEELKKRDKLLAGYLKQIEICLLYTSEKERQVEIESEIFEVDENNQETKKTENKNEEGEA